MAEVSYLTVDGVQLEYLWHGPPPGEATTLVFLHEGLGCVDGWRDFPLKLADMTGCSALVYSRQGYGRSDPCRLPRPLSYMHDEALKVLPEVIEAVGVKEHILVGHSDGGSIAIIYAGGVEVESLVGVVTLSAHVFCEPLSVSSIRGAKQAYEQGGLADGLVKYHGNNTHCAFWGWNDAWLHPEFVYWNIEEYLPSIKVPLLVLQGVDDQYGTSAQVDGIVAGVDGKVEVSMLADCAHSPHREQAVQTLQLITRFVAEVIA